MARFSSRFLMAAFACALGAFSPGAMMRSTVAPQAVVSSKRKRGLFNGQVVPNTETLRGTRMRHYTVAMAKRAATKKRNQARHRRSCRG